MSDAVIQIEGLGKRYRLGAMRSLDKTFREVIASRFGRLVRGGGGMRKGVGGEDERDFWALRDVNVEVEPGQVVGIIGRNGAGKSTLLKVLSRITDPTEGRAVIRGRVGSLLEVGTGFHPELSGRENIFLNGAILGMRRGEIRKRFEEIVEFSGVGRFLDTPVKRYSSGMRVRLAFAVAAHLEPEVLIVDEVLAVGDAGFQQKCLGKMREVADGGGRTVLFVSHNMGAVRSLCKRAVMLDGGMVVEDGDAGSVVESYLRKTSEIAGQTGWSEGDAPSAEGVTLVRAYLTDESGKRASHFDWRKRFCLVIEYELAEAKRGMLVGFKMSASEGTVVCGSTDWQHALPDRAAGRYVSRCWFPGRLLNGGDYLVTIAAQIPPYAGSFLRVADCISFTVADGEGLGPHRVLPGIVRPELEWEVDRAA